ncbi:MAG: DNA-3-methyladenine glycosylase 2 family protein [Geminicoccaceae bacterium]|nr:DNA-3-methyladenine glycosylase 2 family protein [Geminicoccaceae bacterium]MCX8100767.1 DNA-3-methyladenine glycosylase 2 family protein [Geminicoccaceae bacterium]MDW8370627.1 DNA-3-methyladenine glycosylase 2 family protein [Geminicoccaceae bacterium]
MTEPSLDGAGLAAALAALAERDRDIAVALDRFGPPAPRRRPPGFATLLRILVAQQLSTRAAAAIWARLERTLGAPVEPASLHAVDEAVLCATGLGRRKAAQARALATAALNGRLPLEALDRMADEEVVARIAALPGFGRWSAEIYLLFALGRIDVFPADDLALRAGYARLRGIEQRPSPRVLRALVQPWAPFRGAAALVLWHLHGAATLDAGPSPAATEDRAL